ncbi:MAG: tmoS1 [Clostridia bacterium]|jgi:PAS domain S-box-containing protein|nr:tmoS1 [Clostridia bacterium]
MRNNRWGEYSYLTVLLIIIAVFMCCSSETFSKETSKKHVLVVASYHPENIWSNDELKGIKKQLGSAKYAIDITVEYMDSKNHSGTEYINKLYDLYDYKYKNINFDVIICTDNDAFNFMKIYGEKLFSHTPVVFCGVNNFNESLIEGLDNFTGVAEIVNIQRTLDVALELHPGTKEILVFLDNTTTGLENRKIFNELVGKYKVKFNFYQGMDIDYAVSMVEDLSKGTIVFIAAGFKDEGGAYLSMEDGCRIISSKCSVPLYGCWDFYINSGVVGGLMTSGYVEGQNAAFLALKTLEGQLPSDIPVVKNSKYQYMFNYNKLKQFKINLSDLPRGAILYNLPKQFYTIPKVYTWAIIFILIIIIIVLISVNYKRKAAQKALQESDALLRTVINSLHDIICFKDSEGRWIEANDAMLRLYKTDRKIIGKTDEELSKLMPEFKTQFAFCSSTDKIAWETRNFSRAEEVFSGVGEEDKIYEVVKIPLFNEDGSKKGLVALGHDVTEHRKAEGLRKKSEENDRLINELLHYEKIRTDFFANLSHEFKTPLNLIFSALQMVELLERDQSANNIPCRLTNYTAIMKQNCFRLLRIVNNLIDITKIDAGYLQLQLKNENIVFIIEEITLSVKDYIENKGISLIFDTDIEEKMIACDSDKVERIMLNLLSNAIKFTSSGGKIEVIVTDRGDHVNISVKDTGIGIPEEKQNMIFERFMQVDKSLSRNREGSGIGLSLVKSLVELHNGSISVRSQFGQGSEFIIILPAVTIHKESPPVDSSVYTAQTKIDRINIEFSDIYG